MRLRTTLRVAVEKLFNVRIYRITPRGLDVPADIRRAFPALDVETVFDIGANVGQSVDRYLKEFRHAHIFSFEPSRSTFEQLQDRFRGSTRVSCFNYAMSDHIGYAEMEQTEASDLRRLVQNASEGDLVEKVQLTTLDAFCFERAIDKIEYLKIDTEGHELQVLAGAAEMLKREAVAILELELGVNPDNRRHTRLEDAKELLEMLGYRIFAVTEQTPEFPTNRQHLRRVNVIFVSQTLASVSDLDPTNHFLPKSADDKEN